MDHGNQPAPKRSHGHDQALASDTFDKFCSASTLKDILALYRQLCSVCKLVPANFQEFFPKIRGKISSWKADELWSRFEKKAAEKCYARGRYCEKTKVLVIGGGPCGLRAAIDAQLLGAKVVVIEKRNEFSRNNVVHLWPFVITDLRALGAKALYGKFCAGSIDHISIRQLQCILVKVALMLGVEIYEGVGFQKLIEPTSSALDDGWRCSITPPTHPLAQYQFDVILGADGRRSILSSEGFKRKALRAKLAIAITANFTNKHTEAEAKVQEISGVSYIFRQQFFEDMYDAMGIALENIVYYKDETHYFVMTPKKQSLLEKRVLYQDFPEPELLLSPANVDQEALQRYTMEAVVFATDNRLPELEFALNHYGQPDVAVFDFTTMYASENACRAIQRKGHKLLIGLLGDALLEPFWPTGSGCARGFLASYDAGWMIRQWGKGLNSILEVLAERESIYRLLGQTTPENLSKDHSQYNIDPRTRYPKINLGAVNARQITSLFDSDTPIQDIFDPIRDPNSKSMKEFVMPEDFLVRWLQEQLSSTGINNFGNICEVFNGAFALPALIHRYRPDLIESPLPDIIDAGIRNQLLIDIIREEFNVHFPLEYERLAHCGDRERSVLIRYLSQVYLRLKGDIPRENIYDCTFSYGSNGNNKTQQYPNNSKLHHSLSIKEFLRAKELLERNRKEQENNNQSRREKRRSQFYETLMQSENQVNGVGGGGGLQRSQTSISVVIPPVKLNPVPPGELFAACRAGRGKDIACETRPASVASSAPNSRVLTRSRSDVSGFRRGPTPLIPSSSSTRLTIGLGGPVRKGSNNHNIINANSEQPEDNSEALEMQMKIMKRRTTPTGNIISTFMQKQALANAIASPEPEEQENWTKRQIRDMRARSLNQNTFNGWGKKPENEGSHLQKQQQQPLGPGADVSFKDRCKFLEKNIYNSGRDIKVHCSSAPWFSEGGCSNNSNSTSPIPPPTRSPTSRGPSAPPPPVSSLPLQKSPTSAGISTCFMASKKQQLTQQPPFINNKLKEDLPIHTFKLQLKQQQQQKPHHSQPSNSHRHQNGSSNIPKISLQPQQHQVELQSIEKKLGSAIAGIKAQLVNPPRYHINGQVIHPGNCNNNNNADNNNNSKSESRQQQQQHMNRSRTSSGSSPTMPQSPNQQQQPPPAPLRRSATSIGVHNHLYHPSILQNQHGRAMMIPSSASFANNGGNPRIVTDSSGESDTDLEFLKNIDFEHIDGQELQELLSSF